MAETPSSVFHNDLSACNDFDVTGQIHSIQCRTLVLCGSYDRMTPQQNSQYLADTIPGAQIHVIPEAGHMVMIEKSHEVALSLARFLMG
jgi:pimeloyl-ACP methyl ester carboxylesterase